MDFLRPGRRERGADEPARGGPGPLAGVVLAFDTSTSAGSVAVGRDGVVLAEVGVGVRSRQAELLLPAIDFALRAAGTSIAEVRAVLVGGGPGSFTGVRIAAATAKALVHARGVPLHACSSLLVQAASAALPDRPVCALFDARRGEVYSGCWRFPALARTECVLPPGARPLDEVLDLLEERGLLAQMRGSPGDAPLYVGDGALAHRASIEARGGRVPPAHQAGGPRAAALIWLASLDAPPARVAEPAAWEPDYLRAPGAERALAP